MMKLVKTVTVACLVLASACASAQIETGNTLYAQRSGYWNSFLLVFPKEVYARTSTESIDGSLIALTFNFVPPRCEPVLEFLLSVGVIASRDNVRNDVSVIMRTDSGDRVSLPATSIVTMGDKYAMIHVPTSSNLLGQIGEMSRGQTLRVKIVFGNNESTATYNVYSLNGMTAAYRRASTMCTNPASVRGQ